jgi:hypothetical protein
VTGLDSFGDVLRFCGCAILASVCLLILRGLDKNGISGAVSACFGAIFALTAVLAAKPVLAFFRTCGGFYCDNAWADLLLRAMAFGITIQLTADTVRDAGEGGLADRVEMVGRVVLLGLGMPLYKEVLALAGQLLGM